MAGGELLLVLLVLAIPCALLVAAILGIAAFVKVSGVKRQLGDLESGLAQLLRRISGLEKRVDEAESRAAAAGVEEVSAEAPAPAPAPAPPPEPGKAAAVAAPAKAPPPLPEKAKPEPAAPEPAAPEPGAPEPGKPDAEKPAAAAAREAKPAPRRAAARKLAPASRTARKQATDAEWWSKLEATVGKQWMTWAGMLALIVGVGFFVKHAFDNDWIGPGGKVLIGAAFGVGLVVLGHFAIVRKMRPLGQGIVGGGLAVLYVALWAAYGYYSLIPQLAAFGAMVVVTAVGIGLALRHDSMAMSILATIGGFITPLLVSKGTDPRDALFSYLILLDLGILALAFLKGWRVLDSLAFICSAGMYLGWYHKFYTPAAAVPAMLWLGALYAIFLVAPFAYHLRTRTAIRGERFAQAVGNATFFIVYGFRILYPAQSIALGLIALGMAAIYIAMGYLSAVRIREDKRGVFGFVAMAVTFLTMSAPLMLELNAITIAWALEAPLLLFLAYRFDYRPGRYFAAAVLALAFGRIFQGHWPLHSKSFAFVFNGTFATVLFVPAAAAAFAVIGHIFRDKADTDGADRVVKVAAAIAGGFLAVVLLHAEVALYADLCWTYADRVFYGRCCATGLWAAAALVFVGAGLKLGSKAGRTSGAVAMAISIVMGVALFAHQLPDGTAAFFNHRFAAAMLVAGALAAHGRLLRSFKGLATDGEMRLGMFLYGVVIAALALLHTVELQFYAGNAFGNADTASIWSLTRIALVWVVGAYCYLVLGLRMRSLPMRTAGVVALAIGAVLAARLYGYEQEEVYALFMSPRFRSAMLAIVAVFGYSYVMKRCSALLQGQEPQLADYLRWSVAGMLFLLLSCDVYGHFRRSVSDPDKARYMAQMALSLVWALYAVALLALGFWRRSRPVRFVALGLFGLTAAKLVLVDMATVKQIYRIVAFMAVGVLFVGAAYVYHRVETMLEPPREDGGEEVGRTE